MKHQQTSVCLPSKLTAVTWQIKLWGVPEPQLEARKPVGAADLSDKPLFSKSSSGFTLASKVSFPHLLEQSKRLVLTVERNRSGEKAVHLKLVSSELQRPAW